MNRQLKLMAKMPFAPVVAAMFGIITLILIFMTPGWLFERLILASGLPSVIDAAQPPLGETARKLSAIAGGLGVFAGLWVVLSLIRAIIKRNAPPKARGSRIDAATPVAEAPVMKRKRDPIFAERELGAPFMSDEAIATAAIIAPSEEPTVAAERMIPEVVVPEPDAAPQSEQEKPLVLDRIAPAPANETPDLVSEMARLEAALERRAKRGLSAKPLGTGDITSLRNALRGLN
jgi:hypothetical protein